MLTLGSTKKPCVAQKTVVSTKKKMSGIKVNVAQENYTSHKNVCCVNKKSYVILKRRLVLAKYV